MLAKIESFLVDLRRRWFIRLLMAALLSSALAALLLTQTSLSSIGAVLFSCDWRLALLGFLLYILANWFKAVRLRLTTLTHDHSVSLFAMFEVACLYNLATGIFPLGSGEISYPYLMRRWHGVRITRSTPALLVTRLVDLITISFFFLLATVLSRHHLTASPQLLTAAAVVLVTASTLLLFAPWFLQSILRGMEQLRAHLLGGYFRELSGRLLSAGYKVIDNLNSERNPGFYLYLLIYSLLIWLPSYWVFEVVLESLGYDFTFWMAALGGSLAIMTNLLPLQGVAGLGIREAGWVLGLTSLGLRPGDAVALAFSIHAVTLSYLVALGLAAAIIGRCWCMFFADTAKRSTQ